MNHTEKPLAINLSDGIRLIKDGFKADIVIFDPKEVKTYATRDNPKQYPIGIDYVIVNGQIIIDNGNNTGILAGKALRRGKLT